MVWSRNSSEGFLSTPSARRATSAAASGLCCSNNFYPRPPRGGRLVIHVANSRRYGISIHALREEGDGQSAGCPHRTDGFLSTPSARRATDIRHHHVRAGTISIHALREEGDKQQCGDELQQRNFYPRPPRGGRLKDGYLFSNQYDFYPRPPRGGRQPAVLGENRPKIFLSTPSARRATVSPGSTSST